MNQASSIQSIGGTCESITIGHNMSKLPLSYKGIFLETHRPQFLCEKLLDENDEEGASFRRSKSTDANEDDLNTLKHRRSLISFRRSTTGPSDDDLNTSKHRSSGSLLGELLHSYSLRILPSSTLMF